MTNKKIIMSLASDLKRVALGFNRGSNQMASRFLAEVLKRKKQIDPAKNKPYINKILQKIDDKINADDALMYSTILQNYTLKTD